MFQISVEQHFDAAHFLRGYQGKCESLHGHQFRVIVRIKASQTNDIGIVYDFAILKRHLADVLTKFDHTCLNDIPPFTKINPSSENIAVYIYGEIKPLLAEAPVVITAVEVWESPGSGISYSPD